MNPVVVGSTEDCNLARNWGVASMLKIKASDIVSDIRARLSDFELMVKYDLSSDELDTVLKRLANEGEIRLEELQERSPFFDDPANRRETRASPRAYLRVPLPVQELKDPSNQGVITDVSPTGFRARGISAEIGDEKDLIIRASGIESACAIELGATCRWSNKKGGDRWLWETGFKITRVTQEGLSTIQKVITLLNMGDRNLMRSKTRRS
jgi:hypothetical protein